MITNNKKITSLQTGFTLVEILIAMTLLSMILLLVFSSLHAAGRTWESSANQIELADEFRITSQFIRKNLSQAVPLVWINKTERKIAFSGKRDEINFVAPLPSHRGGGGLSLLTLKASEEDKNNLMLYYRLATPDHQSFDFEFSNDRNNSTVLAENIESVEFSYFGSEHPDDEPAWYDEWEIKDQIPLLVRLKINSTQPSTVWPEMIIALRSRAENGQPQFYQVANAENF